MSAPENDNNPFAIKFIPPDIRQTHEFSVFDYESSGIVLSEIDMPHPEIVTLSSGTSALVEGRSSIATEKLNVRF